MTFQQFYFTQDVIEMLSKKEGTISREALYDSATKHYEQFRSTPHFFDMVVEHGFEYSVQEYVYGLEYGFIPKC